MLAEIISTDIQNIIILAMTPVIIAIIPYIFRDRKNAKKRAESVVEAAETVHSTGKAQLEVLSMMENAFMNIGELRGDIAEVHDDLKELKREVRDHIESDEVFMSKTFGYMAKTEPNIEKIKVTVVDSNTIAHQSANDHEEDRTLAQQDRELAAQDRQ